MLLDVVIDEAEIPTFQATPGLRPRRRRDAVAGRDRGGARVDGCVAVGRACRLVVGGSAAVPEPHPRPGSRSRRATAGCRRCGCVCTFEAPLARRSSPARRSSSRDGFEASRIGWREMTVVGLRRDGRGPGSPAASATGRLTAYPTGLAGAPERPRRVSFDGVAGRARCSRPLDVPDADPIEPVDVLTARPVRDGRRSGAVTGSIAAAAGPCRSTPSIVPVHDRRPGRRELDPRRPAQAPATPLLALIALLTAGVLGAGHAADAGPRQDADGRVPRRHARDAAPRRGPRAWR